MTISASSISERNDLRCQISQSRCHSNFKCHGNGIREWRKSVLEATRGWKHRSSSQGNTSTEFRITWQVTRRFYLQYYLDIPLFWSLLHMLLVAIDLIIDRSVNWSSLSGVPTSFITTIIIIHILLRQLKAFISTQR